MNGTCWITPAYLHMVNAGQRHFNIESIPVHR